MFWSHEKLEFECEENPDLIQPFDKNFIKYGAYELGLGDEVFITGGANVTKQVLTPGQQISIPPGQFGLLMTEEKLTIPHNAIGFISIKFGIKQRGLVNVSGFHVDPGFPGRLKFAVYNAGSSKVVLAQGERVFMIWLCDLYPTNHAYQGEHANQDGITSEDIMRLQQEVASPAALKKQIEDWRTNHEMRFSALDDKLDQRLSALDDKMDNRLSGLEDKITSRATYIVMLLTALIVAVFMRTCDTTSPVRPSSSPQITNEKMPSNESSRSSTPVSNPNDNPISNSNSAKIEPTK
jgi:dCTP deaminase